MWDMRSHRYVLDLIGFRGDKQGHCESHAFCGYWRGLGLVRGISEVKVRLPVLVLTVKRTPFSISVRSEELQTRLFVFRRCSKQLLWRKLHIIPQDPQSWWSLWRTQSTLILCNTRCEQYQALHPPSAL